MKFASFCQALSNWAGSSKTFIAAIVLIIIWALTGPFFHYNDTWQLIINTSTTIITFLMVFLIQNTQNRDNDILHLKIDELIRAPRMRRTRRWGWTKWAPWNCVNCASTTERSVKPMRSMSSRKWSERQTMECLRTPLPMNNDSGRRHYAGVSNVSATAHRCRPAENEPCGSFPLLVEDLVALGRLLKRHPMGDDCLRLQVSGLDMPEQFRKEALDMGLAHLECQAFVECIAKQEAVNRSGIHPRYTHHATATHGCDALTQRFAAAAFKLERGHDGFRGAALGFKTDCIDYRIHAAIARGLANDGVCRVIVVIEIDRDHAVRALRIFESIGVVIDHKCVRPEHSGAPR